MYMKWYFSDVWKLFFLGFLSYLCFLGDEVCEFLLYYCGKIAVFVPELSRLT